MQMCACKLARTPKVIKKNKKEDEHADADYICIYNFDNNYGPRYSCRIVFSLLLSYFIFDTTKSSIFVSIYEIGLILMIYFGILTGLVIL